jgi:hypothetical protein
MSAETHRRFLLRFFEVGSTVWYRAHVQYPTTASEATEHASEFMLAQCRGAVGSTDATHVVCDPHAIQAQAHRGYKEKYTARVSLHYN